MNAKVRLATYIVALVVAVVVGGLVLFNIVNVESAKNAIGVVTIIFAGVFGLAARNVTPDGDGAESVESTD